MSTPTGEHDHHDHVDRVRRFYDRESTRYETQRYGASEPGVSRPYLERLRLILDMFDTNAGNVLDLGCGPGVLEPHLLDRGCRVFAVDLSAKMIEKARSAVAEHPQSARASFFVARADALPFTNGAFDAVTCIGVLAYWPDLRKGLEEIARVLRPGGQLIIQASNRLSPREWEDVVVRRPYHWLRSALSGRDFRDADFPLRTVVPWRLESALSAASLVPQVRRHYDFQAPLLAWALPRVSERIASSMLRFSSSRATGLLARGLLIKAIRE